MYKKSLFLLFLLTFITSIFGNTKLRDLSIYTTGGISIKPNFQSNITNYTADVQSDSYEVSIKLLPMDEKASLTLNNKEVKASELTSIPLITGTNTILIDVNNGGKKETYTIKIEKESIKAVADKFLKFNYLDKETGRIMPYRLYVPENYDGKTAYPLVLFLHGGGERGNDNEAQLMANQGATIWAKKEEQAKRPSFVLAPQASNTWDGGFGLTRNEQNQVDLANVFTPTKDLALAYKVLMEVMKNYKVDNNRIYSTGVSQGGFGTWNLNIMYPNLFAAMIPICGGADPKLASKLVNKPIWAFHAEGDTIIPVSYTRNMVEALKNKGNKVIYTEYDKTTYIKPVEHFSWVLAYKNEEMREWLFKQKKN